MGQIADWLFDCGQSGEMELEARIKNVTQEGFDYMLAKLRAAGVWSSTASSATVDTSYSGGARGTRSLDDPAAQEQFIKKGRSRKMDCELIVGGVTCPVRFAMQREAVVSGVGRTTTGYVRVKRRETFVYKRSFKYELTTVQSGSSLEEALQTVGVPEVEVEWCGREGYVAALAKGPTPDGRSLEVEIAQGLLRKVRDLIAMHSRGEEKAAAAGSS